MTADEVANSAKIAEIRAGDEFGTVDGGVPFPESFKDMPMIVRPTPPLLAASSADTTATRVSRMTRYIRRIKARLPYLRSFRGYTEDEATAAGDAADALELLLEVAEAAEWLLSAAVVQHGADCRDTSGRIDCVCGRARIEEALKPFIQDESGGH